MRVGAGHFVSLHRADSIRAYPAVEMSTALRGGEV